MLAPLFAAALIATAALTAPQEALVQASITDVARHEPPPVAFREIRTATVTDADGTPRDLVCGEARMGDRWDLFGSRRTMSGYEHLVGSMARVWCEEPGLTWTPQPELAPRYKAEVAGR